MKQTLIKGCGGNQLTLFFHGWGMDSNVATLASNVDTLIVYDYSSLDFDYTLLSTYTTIHLYAWSMGVWAAEQIELPNIASATAINGTPHPMNDTLGIPQNLFNATLENLNEENLKRFYRRMCSDRERLLRFQPPHRTIQSLQDELSHIGNLSSSQSPYPHLWDKAIVGSRDLIFPTANQLIYWQEKAEIIDAPHYIW